MYLFSDVSIFIDVIKVESPNELFLHCASQQDRKPHNKILEQKQQLLTRVQNITQGKKLKQKNWTQQQHISDLKSHEVNKTSLDASTTFLLGHTIHVGY